MPLHPTKNNGSQGAESWLISISFPFTQGSSRQKICSATSLVQSELRGSLGQSRPHQVVENLIHFQVQFRFCNMNSEGRVEMLQLGVVQIRVQPQVGRHDTQGSVLKLLTGGLSKKRACSVERAGSSVHAAPQNRKCCGWSWWYISKIVPPESYGMLLTHFLFWVARLWELSGAGQKGGRTLWQDRSPVGHSQKNWADENISCKHTMVLWVTFFILAIHTLGPWVVAIHNFGLKHELFTTSTKHVHCTYLDA